MLLLIFDHSGIVVLRLFSDSAVLPPRAWNLKNLSNDKGWVCSNIVCIEWNKQFERRLGFDPPLCRVTNFCIKSSQEGQRPHKNVRGQGASFDRHLRPCRFLRPPHFCAPPLCYPTPHLLSGQIARRFQQPNRLTDHTRVDCTTHVVNRCHTRFNCTTHTSRLH